MGKHSENSKRIQPIGKIPSVTEKILDRMVELISAGTFQPGEKLPSEKDLARQLMVSRPSLREALMILQARGLLEIKPRSGTYVRSAAPQQFRDMLEHMLEFEPNKMWELLEVRKYMDSAAAELAAMRRTYDELREFKNLLNQVTSVMNRRTEKEIEIERAYGRFFKHLALSSHNTLFSHFIESIADMVRRALPFARIKFESIPQSRETIIDQLLQIVDAIERQQPQLARTLVIEHIEYVEKSLRKVMGNTVTNGKLIRY